MNKKVKESAIKKKTKYDGDEDLEIREVAYLNTNSQKFLFCVLIILFGIMLSVSILSITKYYKNNSIAGEIIEINNNRNRILITNNGEVNREINEDSFNDDGKLIVESIDSISLTNKNDKENENIVYDVRYIINKNTFNKNVYATGNSDLLVRFSYSYDGEEWNYIKNTISTTNSTINSLMGDYYDISGVNGILKIETNYKLEAGANKTNKIYWRAETLFQKNKNSNFGVLDAEFKIEYKDNA